MQKAEPSWLGCNLKKVAAAGMAVAAFGGFALAVQPNMFWDYDYDDS